MKNIRIFETENGYKSEENLVYPHVCLTQDTNKVFVKKDKIELITFYLRHNDFDNMFFAEPNMTWYQWCNSQYNGKVYEYMDGELIEMYYNIYECPSDNSNVSYLYEEFQFGGSSSMVITLNNEWVNGGDLIIENQIYNETLIMN